MKKSISRIAFETRSALILAAVVCLAAIGNVSAAAADDGWKAEWERVKAAARKEGKLVAAIPPNPALRRKLEEVMQKKFGLELELVLAAGSKISRRIADEYEAGIHYFDVAVLSAQQVVHRLGPMGAVQPIEPFLILPEVKDPKEWWGGHIYMDKGKKLVYSPLAYMMDNVWYNASLVKEEDVRSWDDLLNPRWKGKIGLFDPRLGGAGRGIWGFVWQAKGEEYLKKLAAQDLVLGDRRPLADQLAKGKLAITIGPTFYTFQQFTKVGLPLKPFPKMREGTYVSQGTGGPVVMSKPPHPNATKVFVNYLLSQEGQEMYCHVQGQATRRLDVDTSWMPKIGVRPAKDSLPVEAFHQRENQSEEKLDDIRLPSLKFARKLFD